MWLLGPWNTSACPEFILLKVLIIDQLRQKHNRFGKGSSHMVCKL